MKKILMVCLTILCAWRSLATAQVGGNVGYAQAGGRAKAEQNEHAARVVGKDEMPPSANSMFVDAHMLINVHADEYVAVFGVLQEGETSFFRNRSVDGSGVSVIWPIRAEFPARDFHTAVIHRVGRQ